MHNDDYGDIQERAEQARRNAEARAAAIRAALADDNQRIIEAQRERREATRPLRRGQP